MRRTHRDYRYWYPEGTPAYPTAGTPFYPHESGLGPLPIILLAAFGIATAANGLSMVMGSPFLLYLVIALGLYGFKLYFLLRYQPRFAQTVDSRRDKVFGYVILAIILFILSAFGLYGFGSVSSADTISSTQATLSNGSFLLFLKATFSKETYAIVCWIVVAVIEVIIIILVLRDHREYEHWE
jgi:hypothetical protein